MAARITGRGSAEQAGTLNYWTKEDRERETARLRPERERQLLPGQAAGKPGGGGGGGREQRPRASWTGGGAVLMLTGKVLFTMNSGDYICTGTADQGHRE